ncbi:MAG: 2-oxoacid:acceptor oxidoreductase family protein [Candidatus Delongbacteria bacterium]|nr:2-oxoacid:acceptor oxidoreductase family protein [Candidatus Delongbacteria bacterium]
MSNYFEIRWHGRGGQGTVTGAKSLAEAVQGTGKYVVAFPEYGPERRGAPLRAFNRFADKNIRIHTPVKNPDVVIIVDPTLIGAPDLVAGISSTTLFIVNSEKPAAEVKKMLGLTEQKVYTVPANRISYELFKREIPNSAMLGAFSRACDQVIGLEKLMEESGHVFESLLGKELVAKNLQAVERGYREGEVA